MSFQDRSLECFDCGATFTFSADEQEFFAGKGFTNDPKRCPTCRQARKTNSGGGYGSYGSRPPREMHAVVCAQCGKDAEVPFRPTGDRPVYCSDCYRQQAGPSRGPSSYR